MIKNKTIGMIAACDINGLIGYDGQVVFKNSVDLKRFKNLTIGSTIVMGRTTFEAFPKPLPNRRHHVLSYSIDSKCDHDEVKFFRSMLTAIEEAPTDLVWIVGGGQVYQEAMMLRIADFIDLTIYNAMCMPGIMDNLETSKRKSVKFPHVDYTYRVVSETINVEDPKLSHRRYEIRPEWAWKA